MRQIFVVRVWSLEILLCIFPETLIILSADFTRTPTLLEYFMFSVCYCNKQKLFYPPDCSRISSYFQNSPLHRKWSQPNLFWQTLTLSTYLRSSFKITTQSGFPSLDNALFKHGTIKHSRSQSAEIIIPNTSQTSVLWNSC